MKFKNQLYILAGTAFLVLVVFAVSGLNIEIKIGNKNSQGSSAAQNADKLQGPQVDSMSDHHQPKQAETAVFDNLLGRQAPDFTLEDYDGKKVSLKSLRGKNVILFFNEGLMCYPSCWNQIVAFGKDNRFNNENTATFSIVIDPRIDWQQAIDKMPELAGLPVLFDTDQLVSNTYGVLTVASSMHRGQFPGHTYIIIDEEGIVRFTQDDEQMAVRNQELAAEMDKI